MKNLDLYLSIAKNLGKSAGDLCLKLQEQLGEVHYKSQKDIVTIADIKSENLIVDGLKKAFPTHSICTEEKGFLKGDDFLWLIDPIDGTVNFSRGIPLWGISIALHYRNEPLIGVINLPKLGEIFYASYGGGAFLNDIPIHISDTSNPIHALISNGDFNVGNVQEINSENLKNFSREAMAFERVKCFGSAVVESSFVACGRLDGYVMTTSYPWDIAAGALIVKEAGGKVTDFCGEPLQYKDSERVLFSNGTLHETLIKILS